MYNRPYLSRAAARRELSLVLGAVACVADLLEEPRICDASQHIVSTAHQRR